MNAIGNKGQQEDPQCDAARWYLQLGFPRPLPPSFCDHFASNKGPDPTDILHLAAKGRLISGNDDTILLVRNSTVASHTGPVRICVPLLARPQIMHACHADASCHLGVICTLKILQRFN